MDNNELTGGVRNALERKESLEKVRQSFINAGYDKVKVESAIREASSNIYSQTPVQEIIPNPTNPITPLPTQSGFQPLPSIQPQQTNVGKSKTTYWAILIIISIIILAGAAILGLYWSNVKTIFGL